MRAGPLHRLGPQRRLRRAAGGPRGLRAARCPRASRTSAAAPLLCGGVIGYRSLQMSGIEPGGRLGLYGFGASARLAMQVARHWGCEVYVAHPQRRRAGSGRSSSARLGRRLRRAAAGAARRRDDLRAGRRRWWSRRCAALDRGGTVAINAIHLDRIPAFDYDRLWLRAPLRSVANFTRADARELLRAGRRDPDRHRRRDVPAGAGQRGAARGWTPARSGAPRCCRWLVMVEAAAWRRSGL